MTQPDPQQLTSTGPGNPVAYPDRHWRKGDLELLVALAKGSTRRDAARAAGISERTAYRRLADPQFRTQLDTLRQRLLTARIQHEATPPPENAAAANTHLPAAPTPNPPNQPTTNLHAPRLPVPNPPTRHKQTPTPNQRQTRPHFESSPWWRTDS